MIFYNACYSPGYTVEDIKACTDADFIIPDVIGVME